MQKWEIFGCWVKLIKRKTTEVIRGLVCTENLFHPGAASTSVLPCVRVWGNGVCTKASISTASWCSASEAFHKVVLEAPEAVHPGGWFMWSKKRHPVPRVRVLPYKQQLCALAGASVPLFKEAKAILPSTGPETSLTANVSWTKSLLVPSGALWNQNLTQIPGMLVLFHLC